MAKAEAIDLIEPWETIKGTALAAVVVSAIGAAIAYIQSIGKKANKAEVDKAIADARVDAAAAVAAAKLDAAVATAAFKVEFEKRSEMLERKISQWEQKSDRFVTREVISDLEHKMEKMEGRIEASINKLGDRLDKLLEAREK